jgi:hypothetical protein
MTKEIVKSVSIANLINQRAGVLAKIKEALDILGTAEQLAIAGNIGFPEVVIDNSCRRFGGSMRIGGRYFDAKERAEIDEAIRRHIDASAWQYLMAESGLRTFMDAATREKWGKALSEDKVPELTAANVEATFASLYNARGEMFEQGVIACFKALSWHYKTNLPQKFGKRIVVSYLTGFHNHNKCDQLDDLLRVFHILDGKPEPDHRNGMYAELSKAGAFYGSRTGTFENVYIKLKWFKNRNGHVEFRRLDLVEKMNGIIAKQFPNALPAPRGGS